MDYEYRIVHVLSLDCACGLYLLETATSAPWEGARGA